MRGSTLFVSNLHHPLRYLSLPRLASPCPPKIPDWHHALKTAIRSSGTATTSSGGSTTRPTRVKQHERGAAQDLSAKTELVGRICVRRRECDCTTRISAGAPQLQNSRTKAGATQVLSWWGRAACVAMDRQAERIDSSYTPTDSHTSQPFDA